MQKLFLILFISVLGAMVGKQVQGTPTAMKDVLLENVEALANMERPEPIECVWSGDLICPNNGVKVGDVFKGYSLR